MASPGAGSRRGTNEPRSHCLFRPKARYGGQVVEPGGSARQSRVSRFGSGARAPNRENGASVVDVFHPSRPLGARVAILAENFDTERASRTIEVKLERMAALTRRLVDEKGNPVVDSVVCLYSDVQYLERGWTPVAPPAEIKDDGSFSFDHLLAGAKYSVQITVEGYNDLVSEHIRAGAGETVRLKKIRLPARRGGDGR